VLKRASILVAVGLCASALAVPALAAVVHVRVEGKTTTIFGATEPRAFGSTPLEVLESASRAAEFYYHVTSTSFGPYVDQVGRFGGTASTGWVFKVDDASPPVGADKVTLKDGDRVLWYYADFGSGGGPKTLRLLAKGGCYRVAAYDDAGKESAAPGAVLHIGNRTLPASFTGSCPGPHTGFVRATAPGMIRSNALA
jgi:hypothetical protein